MTSLSQRLAPAVLVALALSAHAAAQVSSWSRVASANAGGGRQVLVDGSQNVIAMSSFWNGTDWDIRVTKWNSAATQSWVRTFTSGAGISEQGADMALDASNNVYVVGTRDFQTGICFRLAAATGAVNWTYTEGTTSSPFKSIALNSGAVLIGMIRDSGGDRYAIRSLNSATGASNWDADRGFAAGFSNPIVATDGTSNTVLITETEATRYDATGAEVWSVFFPGSIDPHAVRIHTASDAFYIAGDIQGPELDWYVARRKLSDGTMVWAKATNFYNGDDKARDMRLDGAGNPIVVGSADLPQFGWSDAMAVKYLAASGATSWVNAYDGGVSQDDAYSRVWIDGSSNVYALGSSQTTSRFDVLVRKISGSGAALWTTTLDDTGSGLNDEGKAIALDSLGHVYAMGSYNLATGVTEDRVAKLYQTSATPNPASQTGGKSIVWTVALTSAAVGAKVIPLSSNNLAMTVPASVTIPNGATSATFTATTSHVSASTAVSVNAGGALGAATLLPVRPSAVSTNVTSVFCGGALVGTVTLSGPAPAGGLLVGLKDSSAAATTPASVMVDAGATTATFDIPTIPFGADANVTLTAYVGGASAQATFLIRRSVLASVTVAPTSAAAGTSRNGTVTLSGIAAASNIVSLSSSNATVASVPASVAIVKNANAASFAITTGTVAANTNVTISATMNSVTVTAVMTVTPPVLASVDFVADSVRSGNQASGVVRLTAPAPAGGRTVTLSSSSPGVAAVPSSVRVPAGARAVSFLLTAGTVAADTTVVITANGGAVKTTTIVVTP